MEWSFLAGLRFFLSWIVFCFHLAWFLPDSDILVKFNRFGGLAAVIGFLLVSGYSIANSISKEQKGFYKRRIFRIYPLYACSIGVSLLPFLLSRQTEFLVGKVTWKQPDFWNVLGNLLFQQGFITPPLTSNIILWTLSLEVCCYLLAPWFLKMGSRNNLIVIALSAIAWIAYPKLNLPYFAFLGYGLNVVFFLWAWLLGFWYYLNREKTYAKVTLVVLGCVLLALNREHSEKLTILTYLISSLLIVFAPKLSAPKPVLKVLRFLGDISYPLYLFHIPIMVCSTMFLGINNSFGYAFLSMAGASFFYYVIDVYSRKRPSGVLKAS